MFVDGQPVTQYCDANSLAARDRLSLFLKICSAVQSAHERNIAHRDLKPGNILVKRDGSPKTARLWHRQNHGRGDFESEL